MKKVLMCVAVTAVLLGTLFSMSCAGCGRVWTSAVAEGFGADWVVVQFAYDGKPFNCWKLKDASVTNEENSDGIFWKDRSTGHLVHLSGWYNRIQVENADYDGAARLLGVDATQCVSGHYPAS